MGHLRGVGGQKGSSQISRGLQDKDLGPPCLPPNGHFFFFALSLFLFPPVSSFLYLVIFHVAPKEPPQSPSQPEFQLQDSPSIWQHSLCLSNQITEVEKLNGLEQLWMVSASGSRDHPGPSVTDSHYGGQVGHVA